MPIKGWKKIQLECEPRHAVLIKRALKEKDIDVVLQPEKTEAAAYYASFSDDNKNTFYVRTSQYQGAQKIINKILNRLGSDDLSQHAIEAYDKYPHPLNQDKKERQAEDMTYNFKIVAGIIITILIIYYFLQKF